MLLAVAVDEKLLEDWFHSRAITAFSFSRSGFDAAILSTVSTKKQRQK